MFFRFVRLLAYQLNLGVKWGLEDEVRLNSMGSGILSMTSVRYQRRHRRVLKPWGSVPCHQAAVWLLQLGKQSFLPDWLTRKWTFWIGEDFCAYMKETHCPSHPWQTDLCLGFCGENIVWFVFLFFWFFWKACAFFCWRLLSDLFADTPKWELGPIAENNRWELSAIVERATN